jgi:phosphoserine phosphatase
VRPLVVDLDGTLIKTDMLIESCLLLLRTKPMALFLLPFWLLSGKASLKAKIANLVDFDVRYLPYNHELIVYIKEQKLLGRDIWLATASNIKYANQIADHLGLFSKVLASTSEINLSGRRKKDVLIQLCGEKGFDYAGNAMVDVDVWRSAHNGVVVNASSSVESRAKSTTNVEVVFRSEGSIFVAVLKSMRLHQWVKNLLIFVPVIVSHQYSSLINWQQGFLAFLAFSL